MALPIDTDILRMRIQKDLEAKFRYELESKNQELERISDAYYETKRQFEIVKTALEGTKAENEQFIADLRKRHDSEVTELTTLNSQLQLMC